MTSELPELQWGIEVGRRLRMGVAVGYTNTRPPQATEQDTVVMQLLPVTAGLPEVWLFRYRSGWKGEYGPGEYRWAYPGTLDVRETLILILPQKEVGEVSTVYVPFDAPVMELVNETLDTPAELGVSHLNRPRSEAEILKAVERINCLIDPKFVCPEEILAEARADTVAEAVALKAAEEEERYLRYRSSIRGLTEGLNLSILERINIASAMPAPYMVCRHEHEGAFTVIASFCSVEGAYAFLRSILKFVRLQGGGRIDRAAWRRLNLAKAIAFAQEEADKARGRASLAS